MIRILTFFLASLVFMHATIGCCMHHAHACEVECCDAPAAEAEACPCQEHEEEVAAKPTGLVEHDSSRAHDSHSCDGDACTAFVAQSSGDELGNILDQSTGLTSGVAELAIVAIAADTSQLETPSGLVSSVPRLHLVLSVLLI